MAEAKATKSRTAAEALGLKDVSNETGDEWLDGLGVTDPKDQALAVPSLEDPVRQLLDYARANMMTDDEPTEEIYARMAAQILSAKTVDEILDTQDSTKAETILNIPIWVTSIEAQESDEEFADGVGMFVILKGTRADTRAECVISCGGWSVFMEAVAIHRLGQLPQMLVVRQKKRKTKRGFYPLYIGRPL